MAPPSVSPWTDTPLAPALYRWSAAGRRRASCTLRHESLICIDVCGSFFAPILTKGSDYSTQADELRRRADIVATNVEIIARAHSPRPSCSRVQRPTQANPLRSGESCFGYLPHLQSASIRRKAITKTEGVNEAGEGEALDGIRRCTCARTRFRSSCCSLSHREQLGPMD